MKNKILLLLLLLFAIIKIQAQQRVSFSINEWWKFHKGDVAQAKYATLDDAAWEAVNLPHTWNAHDADDNEPGYYRGVSWYRKKLFVDKKWEKSRAIICFEGANQETQLYVNGQFVGDHKGGYTRFCFDITPQLRYGEDNLVSVCVSNAHNPEIPPLSADFTFYGGIYRDVYLMFINPMHISTNDYSSSGVYLRTPEVSDTEATIEITTSLANDSQEDRSVVVENIINDANGQVVKRYAKRIKVATGKTLKDIYGQITIANPHLWDIDDPYLYSVRTIVKESKTGSVLDEVVNPLGLRWFSFDHEKGFFLNGKARKLVGTARHQDYYRKGNALQDEFHVHDVQLLKDMGGNFLRVSHYPQDPVVLETCDRLGIVASVEIPVVNAVTESEEFLNNSVEMAKEMIRQDFNHPSVIIWGYMNEILLSRPYPDGERLKTYYGFTEKVARTLEKTIRCEDPNRYTMMAYHNDPKRYEKAHLTEIPMIQGWNLYQGWYGPDINDFQYLLDRIHRTYKDKILFVTEYGSGVDVKLHSYNPERFDFTQEYGLKFHRHYLKEIQKRTFVAGASIWNMNDFYSESRADVNPHINDKGITSLSREKKDVYWFYKASLSGKPVLIIGNRDWTARGGTANNGSDVCIQSVPIFSNATKVKLFVNGKELGQKTVADACVYFDVPFVDGENVLEAIATINGSEIRDLLRIQFSLVPSQLKDTGVPFKSLNVMLGSHRYLDDRTKNVAWIPEKEYQQGSWGYVGGTPYRRKSGSTTILGTDTDISGADINALFQTQRVGIEAFKADVPDGDYTVSLYWAELETGKKGEALVYNLDNSVEEKTVKNRCFGVSINGISVLDEVNIARDYGCGRAVIKKFSISVKESKGLCISFLRKEGKPILNAIRIYRKY